MSLEIMEGVTKSDDLEEARVKKERQKQIKDVLKKYKPIKDLITGREKEWDATKEIIKNYIIDNLMVGHEIVTRDFLAGIKMTSEIIDARLKAFDDAFEQLGKE